MTSDFYGNKETVSFSAASRTVVQMSAPERDLTGVLDAVETLVYIDRLVLLFKEDNTAQFMDVSDALLIALIPPSKP